MDPNEATTKDLLPGKERDVRDDGIQQEQQQEAFIGEGIEPACVAVSQDQTRCAVPRPELVYARRKKPLLAWYLFLAAVLCFGGYELTRHQQRYMYCIIVI